VKVYLAGAMSYHVKNDSFEKATKWREELKSVLSCHNINCFDPCENFQSNGGYDKKGIVDQNNYYLKQCDLMVVNFEHILDSPGTLYEMFNFAFLRKPIIGFGPLYLLNGYIHLNYVVSQYFATDVCPMEMIYKSISDYIVNMYFQ